MNGRAFPDFLSPQLLLFATSHNRLLGDSIAITASHKLFQIREQLSDQILRPRVLSPHVSVPYPASSLSQVNAATMASRKTQQEIEKTFKKVAEGMATFEGIYEKIKVANNTTQRDRLEENLKREIKKLQRFRDQIKTWAAGNEVKDKTPLLEQRRAIETVRFSTIKQPKLEQGD